MSNVKISQLPNIASITGLDIFPVVTTVSGIPTTCNVNLNSVIAALSSNGVLVSGNVASVYQTISGIQTFNYSLTSGQSRYFIPFPHSFSGVPIVAYNLNIPNSGYLYSMVTSGVSNSGIGIFMSSTINTSGYSISMFARG